MAPIEVVNSCQTCRHPAPGDEENRVSRNRSGKEREDHKCGKRREGDGECAREDEIGQIRGYENRRT